MDALRNPYTPGAGTRPPALTGRDPELEQFALLLGRLERGRPEQSLLITGLRGVGKTVLLDAFEGIAIERGWFASSTEITSETRLAKVIATMTREALLDLRRMERVREKARRALSILKAFTITTGVGVDIRLELDVEEGTIAREAEHGVLFLLDEVQFLERADFEALIAGMHRSTRRQLPITVVGAGLPSLPKLAGEAKSYAERLFPFPTIGALSDPAARLALVEPATEEGVSYEDDALAQILRHRGRYPYFLQQYGKHAWLTGTDNVIDEGAVARAHELVLSVLDTD